MTPATDGGSRADADALDRLAAALAARSAVRFTAASNGVARAAAYELRRAVVREHGWAEGGVDDCEQDEFDPLAVQVLGWRDGAPVCCGRIVLPPGPLPTDVACGITIEPCGRVVDVGRMVVVPTARGRDRTVFVALLAALYLETRARGYTTGCGMMAPNVRALLRHLGVRLDVLAPDRPYRGAPRAPVRFDVDLHGADVIARWTEDSAPVDNQTGVRPTEAE